MEVIDCTACAWFKVWFKELNAIYVHKSLLTDLISLEVSFGNELEQVEPVDYLPIDLGGSIMIGMPKETIKLDLLTIDMWSHQVLGVGQYLENYIDEMRVFPNTNNKYYIINNSYWCLVLSQEQYDVLKNTCYDLSSQAEENFQQFLKTRDKAKK